MRTAETSNRRVLIVEDEAIVRLHLRRSLEGAGFEVVATASTADEAIAAAKEHGPDLVLMDIELDGPRSGIDAALEIRRHHDVALVFLTAYANDDVLRRTAAVGAEGYVVKPFGDEELKATLFTALSSRGRTRTSWAAGRTAQPRRDESAGPRLMIYSHDTFGLGHLRRSLNIAHELVARFTDLSILIVTGSAAAHRYALPPRVDYVKLPAVRKVAPETYEARSLDVDQQSIIAFRKNLLLSSVMDFDPDILLVDHSPVGMRGELQPTLDWLDSERPICTKILGLRDIIDDPTIVREQWLAEGTYDTIERMYDHVFVYGNPDVFNAVERYGFPESMAAKTSFLNYIIEKDDSAAIYGPGTHNKHILVTTGGGDGAVDLVAGAFIDMLRLDEATPLMSATILTGPFANGDSVTSLRKRALGLAVDLHEFVDTTVPYMKGADLVICTGGYNTVMQAVCYAKNVLVIPRVMHRKEQLLRATTFGALGAVRTVTPDRVTPELLRAEVLDALTNGSGLAAVRERIHFDGATAVADFIKTHALLKRQTQGTAND